MKKLSVEEMKLIDSLVKRIKEGGCRDFIVKIVTDKGGKYSIASPGFVPKKER